MTKIPSKNPAKLVMLSVLFSIVQQPCYDGMSYVQEVALAPLRLEQCECRAAEDWVEGKIVNQHGTEQVGQEWECP